MTTGPFRFHSRKKSATTIFKHSKNSSSISSWKGIFTLANAQFVDSDSEEELASPFSNDKFSGWGLGQMKSPTQSRNLSAATQGKDTPGTGIDIGLGLGLGRSLHRAKTQTDSLDLTNSIRVLSMDQTGECNSVLKDTILLTSTKEGIPLVSVEEFKRIHKEFKDMQVKKSKKFCQSFTDLIIVDCRFQFEFKGGHIPGAVNISSITELEEMFFPSEVLATRPTEFTSRSRKLVVFHCEFSSHRGPIKASQLRGFDRHVSGESYPNLYYPDVVILQGGYKDWYEYNGNDISDGYIEMDDPLFNLERERGLDLLRMESRGSLRSESMNRLTLKKSESSLGLIPPPSFKESRRNSRRSQSSIGSIASTNSGLSFQGLLDISRIKKDKDNEEIDTSDVSVSDWDSPTAHTRFGGVFGTDHQGFKIPMKKLDNFIE